MRIVMLFLFVAVCFANCSKEENPTTDNCASIVCGNGGNCIDGTCECPTGYTGTLCEQQVITNACDTLVCANGGTCVNGRCQCICPYYGEQCQLEITDPAFDCETSMRYQGNACPDGFTGFTCTSAFEALLEGTFTYVHATDIYMLSHGPIAIFSKGVNANEFHINIPADSTSPLLVYLQGSRLVVPAQTYKSFNILEGSGSIIAYSKGIHVIIGVIVDPHFARFHISFGKDVYVP